MRRAKVQHRVYWDDPVWIDRVVAVVIMSYDMVQMYRRCHAGVLV